MISTKQVLFALLFLVFLSPVFSQEETEDSEAIQVEGQDIPYKNWNNDEQYKQYLNTLPATMVQEKQNKTEYEKWWNEEKKRRDSLKNTEPEPYKDDEFPVWAKKLRRFEIITLGSYPLSFLVAQWGNEFRRWIDKDFSDAYRPFPFKSNPYPVLGRQEKIGIVISSISISMTVALVDYIIGKVIEKRRARKSGK